MKKEPILSFQFGEQQINPNSEIIFISRFFSFFSARCSAFFYLSKSIIILWKLKNLFYYFIVVIFAFFFSVERNSMLVELKKKRGENEFKWKSI